METPEVVMEARGRSLASAKGPQVSIKTASDHPLTRWVDRRTNKFLDRRS
jgi:hypothetical protein